MNTATVLKKLRAYENYHGRRAFSQLNHLHSIDLARNMGWEDTLCAAGEKLLQSAAQQGAVSAAMVAEFEQALFCYAGTAKEYTLHMVGHAHIDMDWMWGYHETVAATLETFRTVLRLFDPTDDAKTVSVSGSEVYLTNTLEEMLQKLSVAEGKAQTTVSPHSYATFLLK